MRFFPLSACLLAAACAGCGGSERPLVAPKAPHGGTVVVLPNNLGSIEVVRAEVPGKSDQAQLLLYFLDTEGKPMTAGPTAASLRPQGRGVAPVRFQPAAGGDPSRAGALECPPFPASGDVSGELAVTIGGQPVTAVINVR